MSAAGECGGPRWGSVGRETLPGPQQRPPHLFRLTSAQMPGARRDPMKFVNEPSAEGRHRELGNVTVTVVPSIGALAIVSGPEFRVKSGRS
jgi:hypothetical protein